MKDIKNLFRKKKKNSDIKEKIIRDIRTLIESHEENYYESLRIGNAFSWNYIEYESNGDKNKILSTEEYLDKIRPYLSDIKIDRKPKVDGKLNYQWQLILCLL